MKLGTAAKPIALLACFVFAFGLAGATTLTSNNSSLVYNDVSTFTDWAVEGVDHLFAERWYYRVGSGAGAPLTGGSMYVDPDLPYIGVVTYAIPSWGRVIMIHVLSGNEPGTFNSQWSTTITLTRDQGVTDTLNFYNYADYDLTATSSNDTAQWVGLGLFRQTDILTRLVYNVSQVPDFIHVGPCCAINPNVNLNNAAGPYTGDAIFASQFVITGGAFSYSIDRTIEPVPAPGTYALIGAGLLGLGLLRRRLS